MVTEGILDSDWDEEDWEPLIDTIHSDNCVLMLGPDIAIPNGSTTSLNSQLANTFTAYLKEELPKRELKNIDPDYLPRVAHLYGRAKGGDNYPRSRAKKFYQSHKGVTSGLHKRLASLPFRIVITSSHDEMFLRALESVNKKPMVKWYNFKGNQEEMIPTGTVEAPMVYYLYGHPEVPESMVLTENDLLDFLVSVIKGDPALPDNIRSMFNSEDKCYLFFGFGFCNWYLRILLHVMQKQKKNSSVALEKVFEDRLRELQSNALFFKKSGHNLRIVDKEASEFAEALQSHYFSQYADDQDNGNYSRAFLKNAPLVFLSHASENKDQVAVLCDNLKKAGVKVWLDQNDLLGGDDFNDEIRTAIEEKVGYFILVNSAELAERNEGYVIKEINAARERQEGFKEGLNFIIPISFDNTPVMKGIEKLHQISLTGPNNIDDLVKAIKRDQARRQKS